MKTQLPFSFDAYEFVRFVVLSILTTPPNYKWQQYLERTFPAYQRRSTSSLPLTRKDARSAEEEEEIAPMEKPRLNIKNTFLKWFIDCMTLGALFNTVAFFILMGCLKGQSAEQIGNNIRTVSSSRIDSCPAILQRSMAADHVHVQKTIGIIVDSYKIWPVASIVNFALVPVEKRIVFLSSVGLIWGVYMSLVAARV